MTTWAQTLFLAAPLWGAVADACRRSNEHAMAFVSALWAIGCVIGWAICLVNDL